MSKTIPLEHMTAEEHIDLMGRLWDSLEPDEAAPLNPGLAAELDRREADASPGEGQA